jgi:hypothetical protein
VPMLAPAKPAAAVEPPPPTSTQSPPLPPTPKPAATETCDFEVGDRVLMPTGKHGAVTEVRGTRVTVDAEHGGSLVYNAKHLQHATKPPPITSPIVPQGARFVPGRDASGSRS